MGGIDLHALLMHFTSTTIDTSQRALTFGSGQKGCQSLFFGPEEQRLQSIGSIKVQSESTTHFVFGAPFNNLLNALFNPTMLCGLMLVTTTNRTTNAAITINNHILLCIVKTHLVFIALKQGFWYLKTSIVEWCIRRESFINELIVSLVMKKLVIFLVFAVLGLLLTMGCAKQTTKINLVITGWDWGESWLVTNRTLEVDQGSVFGGYADLGEFIAGTFTNATGNNLIEKASNACGGPPEFVLETDEVLVKYKQCVQEFKEGVNAFKILKIEPDGVTIQFDDGFVVAGEEIRSVSAKNPIKITSTPICLQTRSLDAGLDVCIQLIK